MNPIKDINDVIYYWDVFEKNWHSLYAFFLYTNEDKLIAQYVREHFEELDSLSGRNCLIFLIDEPSQAWEDKATRRKYWNEFKFNQVIWEGFTESLPYDKSKAYEIADFLGIAPNQLPCLVFFKNINDFHVAIYQLNNSWSEEKITEELRELFSPLSSARKQLSDKDREELEPRLKRLLERNDDDHDIIFMWEILNQYINKKRNLLRLKKIYEHPITRSIGEILKSIAQKASPI